MPFAFCQYRVSHLCLRCFPVTHSHHMLGA
jgi:hypothetical protein